MMISLAPLYPLLYRGLAPLFPGCLWAGGGTEPAIALTFDDGPHPVYTPALLRVLARYDVRATFFWIGRCVEQAPAIARQVVEQGHQIGLHGYEHRSFIRLSATELQQSLQRTQTAIAQTCDLAPQQLCDVRPPNGLFTPRTLTLLRRWHYRPVMWSVVPEDWVQPGVSTVTRRVLQQVRNGALIVLHDGYTGGGDVAAIAAELIPQLAQQYQFVTVSDLWRQRETQV